MVDVFNRIVPWVKKNFWAKNDNIFLGQDAYIATDKVRARDSDGLLLVDDSDTEGLKVEDGGAVSVTGNWRLKTETEGGTDRLTVTAVGASAAAELFLHPTGSANTSRLTITDAVNTVNYEGIEIEATASANRIGSIAAGTGTVQGLQFQISNSTKMTLDTAGRLGIGTASPDAASLLDVSGSGVRIAKNANATIWLPYSDNSIYLSTDSSVSGGDWIFRTYNGSSTVTRMALTAAGDLGIGISTPDGTAHVHTATAGAVTASVSADDLVVESDGDVGITVLGPDANNKHIYLGETTDNVTAQLSWIGASDLLYVGTHATGGEVQIRSGVGTTAVTIDSSQKVGIGGTPTTKLYVEGTTTDNATVKVKATTATGYGTYNFENSGGTVQSRIHAFNPSWTSGSAGWVADGLAIANNSAGVNIVADGASGIIDFFTGGHNRRMRILSGGNIAIGGGTTANAPLSFGSTGGAKIALYDSGTASQRYGFGIASSELQIYVDTGADITFRDGGYDGTEIMRIDGGTDTVGIGESAPLGKLHVKNGDAGAITPSTNADELIIENSSHAGISILSGSTSVGQISFGDTGAASAGYIQYSHNTNVFTFGVGGSTALWLTSADSLYPGTDNSGSCGTSGNRWTDVWAVDGTINTSDINQKTDIANLPDIAGLGFVNALRPVRFKWVNGERYHFGIMAEELKARLDERGIDAGVFVDPAVNGEQGPLGIRHHELIAPIIKAIQQLDDRLKALETA